MADESKRDNSNAVAAGTCFALVLGLFTLVWWVVTMKEGKVALLIVALIFVPLYLYQYHYYGDDPDGPIVTQVSTPDTIHTGTFQQGVTYSR